MRPIQRLCFAALPIAALFLGSGARADEHEATGSLVKDVTTGAYGGPEMKASTLAGDAVVLVGGEVGWILARSVVLGGGGYASVTDVVSPRSLQSARGDARLHLAYGGFRMGAILADASRVHATVGLLIGGGGASSSDPTGTFTRSDAFVVVEPDVEAELNLTRNVRLALGGGYRIVGSQEESLFSLHRLSGPAAMLAVRLGAF